ncbi:MAG: hypothetical protein QOK16_3946 [Solirubrobacteraceae bacterium]|nr:hypothetical protein [Solirubrobacteraceae bacterium]
MADRTSGDRPADFTNGVVEGQQSRIIGASNQALSDADPTASDSDQASTVTEELAADRDRAARDGDLAIDVNSAAHPLSRDIRRRTARQRQYAARARLDAAAQRDEIADARDIAALARDQAAAARDLSVTQRDIADEHDAGARALTGAETVTRAAAERKRAERRRAQATEQLARAAQDRHAAAQDREQGACERQQALADREALARQAAIIETDELTGARPRAAGLVDLDHELQRCSRAGGRLVIAYVDVIGSKTLDESQDHSTRDELLRCVAARMHEHLRAYDLIVRLGANEFLCAMSSMTLSAARERFGEIATVIDAAPGAGAIAIGFAVLTSHETASELIARAGSDLIVTRGGVSTTDNSPSVT